MKLSGETKYKIRSWFVVEAIVPFLWVASMIGYFFNISILLNISIFFLSLIICYAMFKLIKHFYIKLIS